MEDLGGNSQHDDSDREYWLARQNALPVDFHGEEIEPHEVRFVEEFLALGNRIEWIPKDRTHFPRVSTNDFIWLNNDCLICELKCTSAVYKAVANRISDAVKEAQKHDVVKENFVIYFETAKIPTKLPRQLRMYNQRRTEARISRLWLVFAGKIIEVKLR